MPLKYLWWVKCMQNLPFTGIVSEGFLQEFKFLWKAVVMTDSIGPVNQDVEHSLCVVQMVVRCGRAALIFLLSDWLPYPHPVLVKPYLIPVSQPCQLNPEDGDSMIL
jgi:hypothetical protein